MVLASLVGIPARRLTAYDTLRIASGKLKSSICVK